MNRFKAPKTQVCKRKQTCEFSHLETPLLFFFSIRDILLPGMFSCDLYLKTAKLLKNNLSFDLTERAQ